MATFTHWNKKEKVHLEILKEIKKDYLDNFQVTNLSKTNSTLKLSGGQNEHNKMQLFKRTLFKPSDYLGIQSYKTAEQ